MNLVEVARWIQDGYQKYYYTKKTKGTDASAHDFVLRHVMNLGKGRLNPITIEKLVDLETSIPNESGMVQCSNED